MSSVIKAGDSRTASRGVFSLDLRDIASKAEETLVAARSEAAGIVKAAQRQAGDESSSIKKAAHQEGFERGLAEGRAAGEKMAMETAAKRFSADQSALLLSLTKMLAEFGRQREQLYVSSRRDVVILAVAIASRIASKFSIMEQVAPEIAAEACAEALALIRESTDVVISANPADTAAISRLTVELARTLKSAGHVRINEDANIPRGGISVASAETRIDAGINDRVERIADELVDNWRERMNELNIRP